MSKGIIEAAINGEGEFDNFAYFFHGSQYTKYNWATDSVESGYPAPSSAWKFPGKCANGIDAAFNGAGSSAGKAYFFKSDEYLRYDWEKDATDDGYPQQLSLWNLPGNFANGIDAAVSGKGEYEGKVYFFKGDQYVRYDLESDTVDDGYPQPLSAWNLPGKFSTGIDAALNGKLSYDGKLYFFKDNEYIRYDWATDQPDDLIPKNISAWGISFKAGSSVGNGNHTNKKDFNQSDYEAKAKASYEEVVQNNPGIDNTSSTLNGGHSTSFEVFGEWYDKLQKILIRLNSWSLIEENARQLLAEYASKKVANMISGYVPDNVQYQLERVGLSETNDAPIEAYNKKINQSGNSSILCRSGMDFNAPRGGQNWCAQTQTIAMDKALANHGVKRIDAWDKWSKKRTVSRPNLNLQIGDYLTVITSTSPLTGHVACFIYQEGNTMYYVSGNAGGGGAAGDGTVRIDKVIVEDVPQGYNYWVNQNDSNRIPGSNVPKNTGTIWVINAIKFSVIEFENLDNLINDDNSLSNWGLRRN